ncbi:MAG: WD40 repeat domain-containing protein, partial [Anaerolineae bacterium]|nr:WD40 repeat domain-containing protein [Anaerolineae bacterium]
AGDCPVGELIVWDLATMAETARWPGHDSAVSALAWSPLGDVILSGGEAGDLILWDAASHAALARLDVHDGPIHAVAFNADGTLAATAGADGVVAVLDVPARQIVRRLAGHSVAVLDVAFSPDGGQILSASADASMILWDAASGDFLRTFIGHAAAITGAAFVPDGSAILSSGDLSLRLWDVATGDQMQFRESGDKPAGLVISPDGRTVLHRGGHLIYTWNLQQWNGSHRKLASHEGGIRSIAASADGRFVLSTGDDGTVRVWNLAGASDLRQIPIEFSATSLATTHDGQWLAVGGWAEGSRIWDVETWQPVFPLSGVTGTIAPGAISASRDDRWVAAGSGVYEGDSNEGSLIVWNATTGEVQCNLRGHVTRLRSLSFSPDSRHLLAGSQGPDDAGDLILWNVEDCSLVRRFATEQDTTGIDFSADGRYAVTSSAFFANVTLWDVETGQPVRVFPTTGEVFLDAAFGPGDETILGAAISGVIFEWDRETGEGIRRFSGHDGGVWSLEVSPDEQRLVSSDDTGMIILWDLDSGAELRRHTAHNGLSFQATFNPDGQTIYSVSADETLVAWQVGDPSLPALRAWIKDNRYVRELTCDERAQYGVQPLCKA